MLLVMPNQMGFPMFFANPMQMGAAVTLANAMPLQISAPIPITGGGAMQIPIAIPQMFGTAGAQFQIPIQLQSPMQPIIALNHPLGQPNEMVQMADGKPSVK
jgi:hypothetical protein